MHPILEYEKRDTDILFEVDRDRRRVIDKKTGKIFNLYDCKSNK